VSRLRDVVLPEVEQVRRVVAAVDGRLRRPADLTTECVLRLRRAGLVPAAIADELRLSDGYVEKVLRRA
jgi:hypothetical protein